jgi:hypothetical protein
MLHDEEDREDEEQILRIVFFADGTPEACESFITPPDVPYPPARL